MNVFIRLWFRLRNRRPAEHLPRPCRLAGAQSADEQRQRHFVSLLNKLTVDNFQRIVDQMLSVDAASPATLALFAGQVFGKALAEPCFAGVYAQLCAVLGAALPPCAPSSMISLLWCIL